jgi:hypothetical protein
MYSQVDLNSGVYEILNDMSHISSNAMPVARYCPAEKENSQYGA